MAAHATITPDLEDQIFEYVAENGTDWARLSEWLGINRNTFASWFRRLRARGDERPEIALAKYEERLRQGPGSLPARDDYFAGQGSTTTDVEAPPTLKTLRGSRIVSTDVDHPKIQSLIERENMDPALWVVGRCEVREWDGYIKKGPKGEEVIEKVTLQHGQVRFDPVPKADVSVRLRDYLLEDIRAKVVPALPRSPRRPKASDRHALELALVDAHFGQYSWLEESGEDYDISIAAARYRDAAEYLFAKASVFPLDEIIILVGNDLVHFDGNDYMTTAGTPQDPDTRYIKIFRVARMANSWLIREALRYAPRVRVIIIPGNHDELAAFAIGEVLAMEFANAPNVVVENTAAPRKYYRYGQTLLGWTHGKDENAKRLPALMSIEVPQVLGPDAWGSVLTREFHIGHYHHRKSMETIGTEEVDGVVVRVLPALTATNAWHKRKGYMSRAASEAYLYHIDDGYAGHLSYNVKPVATAFR